MPPAKQCDSSPPGWLGLKFAEGAEAEHAGTRSLSQPLALAPGQMHVQQQALQQSRSQSPLRSPALSMRGTSVPPEKIDVERAVQRVAENMRRIVTDFEKLLNNPTVARPRVQPPLMTPDARSCSRASGGSADYPGSVILRTPPGSQEGRRRHSVHAALARQALCTSRAEAWPSRLLPFTSPGLTHRGCLAAALWPGGPRNGGEPTVPA